MKQKILDLLVQCTCIYDENSMTMLRTYNTKVYELQKMKCVVNESQIITTIYCENIINRGVLIFVDFVVHLNHENKNLTKCNFPIDCCL